MRRMFEEVAAEAEKLKQFLATNDFEEHHVKRAYEVALENLCDHHNDAQQAAEMDLWGHMSFGEKVAWFFGVVDICPMHNRPSSRKRSGHMVNYYQTDHNHRDAPMPGCLCLSCEFQRPFSVLACEWVAGIQTESLLVLIPKIYEKQMERSCFQ